jgi:dihydroxy-acid dehydratase
MMMAMVRLNVPSVFIYGGSILPGRYRAATSPVQDVFEAVGQHQAGELLGRGARHPRARGLPLGGACGAQYTANTMACVSEAIGLALLNSSSAPAPYESRDQYCESSGVAVMSLIEKNIRARDVVTRKRSRTPPAWWAARAARPTRRCTCRPSRTRRGSTSTSSTWPRS